MHVDYKLRRHIAVHLQTRSATIRGALTKYNKLAAKLHRPKLEFKKLCEMTHLAEFDLLRGGRHNILSEPWTVPVYRQYRDIYFKCLRANEEISRLNVEISRVVDWIKLERETYDSAIVATSCSDPALAHEFYERACKQNRVHTVIMKWLHKTSELDGYSGESVPQLLLKVHETQGEEIILSVPEVEEESEEEPEERHATV